MKNRIYAHSLMMSCLYSALKMRKGDFVPVICIESSASSLRLPTGLLLDIKIRHYTVDSFSLFLHAQRTILEQKQVAWRLLTKTVHTFLSFLFFFHSQLRWRGCSVEWVCGGKWWHNNLKTAQQPGRGQIENQKGVIRRWFIRSRYDKWPITIKRIYRYREI